MRSGVDMPVSRTVSAQVEQVAYRSGVAIALRRTGLAFETHRWLVQQLRNDCLCQGFDGATAALVKAVEAIGESIELTRPHTLGSLVHRRNERSGLARRGLDGKVFDLFVDDGTHTISFTGAMRQATVCPCTQVIEVEDRDTRKRADIWLDVAGHADVNNVKRAGARARAGTSNQVGGDDRISGTSARHNNICDGNDVGELLEPDRLAVDSRCQGGAALG